MPLAIVVALPAEMWLLNRVPVVATRRPRSTRWRADGATAVRERVEQPNLLLRFIWLGTFGFLCSAVVFWAAWFLAWTYVGLGTADRLFALVPKAASLFEY
jgi:hypothetical protein